MHVRPTALDHVALKVTDMHASLRFYADVLGFEVVHTSGPHNNGGAVTLVAAGARRLDLFLALISSRSRAAL